jgi:hypothetical protein
VHQCPDEKTYQQSGKSAHHKNKGSTTVRCGGRVIAIDTHAVKINIQVRILYLVYRGMVKHHALMKE